MPNEYRTGYSDVAVKFGKSQYRNRSKGEDPTDITHSKAYNKAWQWIPDLSDMVDTRRLGDLYPQLGGGGGGGGGGYDPYASARAAEARRRAAMRAAIQQQYSTAIRNLQGQNQAAGLNLQAYYNQANQRMKPIYAQNKALTADYAKQLSGYARDASSGVLSSGSSLLRDLAAQGFGGGGLQGQISGDVRDVLGAGAAGNQYNTRLAQVMGANQADNSALLSAILQGGQSNREQAYQQQLAQLQAEQALRLAELA